MEALFSTIITRQIVSKTLHITDAKPMGLNRLSSIRSAFVAVKALMQCQSSPYLGVQSLRLFRKSLLEPESLMLENLKLWVNRTQ